MGETVASRPQIRTAPWSSLFQHQAEVFDDQLEEFDAVLANGRFVVPKEVREEAINEWSDYLVGYFVGPKVSFTVVEDKLKTMWSLKGSITITADQNMFYLYLNAAEDRRMILSKGPVFIAGILFVIKPWTKTVDRERRTLNTIPIWVNIYNVPKSMWSRKGLSFIASRLGKPRRIDEATLRKQRITFARVCVEVKVDFKYPATMEFELEEGLYETVDFEYKWKPTTCSKCLVFGHTVEECETRTVPIWKPKRNGRPQAKTLQDTSNRGGNQNIRGLEVM
ncbi:hypothetical protein ACHQM5_001141 [Ranunculus cassubicifolius]